ASAQPVYQPEAPADQFYKLKASGQKEQAARLLVDAYQASDSKPLLRQMLAAADTDIAVSFLKQTGFLQDAGVYPIDLGKLPEANAYMLTQLIDVLKQDKRFNDGSLVVQALHLRGAALSTPADRNRFIQQNLLDSPDEAVKLMEKVSNQLKAAPGQHPLEQKALTQTLRAMKDGDVLNFLRKIGYAESGTEGYTSMNLKALAHLPSETLRALRDNLDEGYSKFWNWNKWDIVKQLDDEIEARQKPH
ncbi:MAG: hypothetical protein ACAI44_15515, partial [Candidatus Sericytochromatia bacterium]